MKSRKLFLGSSEFKISFLLKVLTYWIERKGKNNPTSSSSENLNSLFAIFILISVLQLLGRKVKKVFILSKSNWWEWWSICSGKCSWEMSWEFSVLYLKGRRRIFSSFQLPGTSANILPNRTSIHQCLLSGLASSSIWYYISVVFWDKFIYWKTSWTRKGM